MKAKRRFNIRRCRLMTNEPLPVLIAQAQALLARVAAHPDHKQLLALGWSPDLYIADAKTALTYLDWEIKPESEAIAQVGKHSDRLTRKCMALHIVTRILTNDTRLQKSQRLGTFTTDRLGPEITAIQSGKSRTVVSNDFGRY